MFILTTPRGIHYIRLNSGLSSLLNKKQISKNK